MFQTINYIVYLICIKKKKNVNSLKILLLYLCFLFFAKKYLKLFLYIKEQEIVNNKFIEKK